MSAILWDIQSDVWYRDFSEPWKLLEAGEDWLAEAARPGSGWRGNFLGELQRRYATNDCRHPPSWAQPNIWKLTPA